MLGFHPVRNGDETQHPPLPAPKSAKLLDQLRERIRYLHYSLRTGQALSACKVLRVDLPWMAEIGRPRSPRRLPVVPGLPASHAFR